MSSRIRVALTVLCLAVHAAPLLASPESHLKATKKFFEAAKMAEVFDAMAVQMTDMQIKTNPLLTPFRESILVFLRKYMSWKELEADVTKLYMKEFTESELKEMTKFYATATGQKVLRKMPELSSEGAAIGARKLEAHGAEFQTILEEAQKKNEAAAKK